MLQNVRKFLPGRRPHVTQEAVGKKLGLSYQQVQKYENGKSRISPSRLFDICEALEVSLSSMFERKLKP
jgi:transcriptional regulator with XRE-family HTH domain